MQWIDSLKRRVKGWMQRTAAGTGVAREYKTVFDLGGVPAFQQFYDIGVFVWKWLWRGYYKPWHLIPAPTIENEKSTRKMYRLGMAKALCAEMAGLVWGEECGINVTIDGRENSNDNSDPLDAFIHDALKKNAFREKMQELVEEALAMGGGTLKVWADVRRDRDGNEIPDTRRLMIGYGMADQFVPTAWDNAKVTEGVFISREAKGGFYYTRLEWHKWNGTTYIISNELYRSEMKTGDGADNQDILGVRYPLAEIYPYLDEETVIPVEESLFSYFRTPIANNIDDNSPLGVSMYGNALDTLHALDICYDSFVREFRLGKKRIIVPARCVRSVVGTDGIMHRYFDATDETYEALSTENAEDLKIHDNTIELRVEEHVAAINAFLSILCLQVGFSAGTFTFDQHTGLKTATEVISENSKTYKTVKTIQNQIKPAVEKLVDNLIRVAVLYEMDYEGTPVAALVAPGYHVNIVFDDGVTQDRQTNINEGITLVGAGLMSKYTFLTDPKYGQGLTEEEAKAELVRIQQESAANVNPLAIFGAGE